MLRSTFRRLACTSSLLVPLAAGACVEAEGDAEAEQASLVVESTADATVVTRLVTVDAAAVAGRPVAEAFPALVDALTARLGADLTAPACAQVTSDQRSYVEVTFDRCTGPRGLAELTGTVRAEVNLVTTPCGPTACVAALDYRVATTGLTVNATALDGAWTVRAPLATSAGATYQWDGELTIAGPRRTVHATSSAQVTLADGCASYAATATLTGAARAITVAAVGVTRCLDACPTAGTVTVGATRGELSWTYRGDGTATVTGPRGREFDVTLACAR
ncbi:MAG: hypothetical protein R3B06_11150 [Kofleriaceae bacterium]